MKRIICIGNRYHPEDDAGALVYERLARMRLPADVEVIDGGLGGLDLLRFVEGAGRVVFVDAAAGGPRGAMAVWTADEIERQTPDAYGHAAGLAYLLSAARIAADGLLPEMLILGLAPAPDGDAVRTAADLCLSLAAEGSGAVREPAAACGASR